MKYKLINKTTKEEHLCTKVVVDGWEYYVSDGLIKIKDWYIDNSVFSLKETTINKGLYQMIHSAWGKEGQGDCKKIICGNNPSIDIPKVIDGLGTLPQKSFEYIKEIGINNTSYSSFVIQGYVEGYNKAKETYSFTEEDMIEFTNFIATYPDKNRNVYGDILHAKSKYDGAETTKSLLQIWKEQRVETIYFQ